MGHSSFKTLGGPDRPGSLLLQGNGRHSGFGHQASTWLDRASGENLIFSYTFFRKEAMEETLFSTTLSWAN